MDLYQDWAQRYPVLTCEVVQAADPDIVAKVAPALEGSSWFGYRVVEGRLLAGCVVCEQLSTKKDLFGRWGIGGAQAGRWYRFDKHAKSPHHIAAALAMLSPQDATILPDPQEAPPPAMFLTLLSWVRKGGAIRDGVASVGGFRRCRKMLWCMAESIKRLSRAALGRAVAINLLRDERHARLLIRFRCSDIALNRSIGVIGQPRITGSTATKITDVTKQAIEQFCTTNFGAPDAPDAPQRFDEDLMEHIRTTTGSATVDAATNEVAACENSISTESITARIQGQEAWFTNLLLILRDKTHATRRMLQRPWQCDAFLQAIGDALISSPGSIAQMIQHSHDLAVWYAESCAASNRRPVETIFHNLRAAKHRFESQCAPLSRISMDWEADIRFWSRVNQERAGTRAAELAKMMLDVLDPEFICQANMLADASCEMLTLIRFFDESEVDSALIASTIKRCLNRLDTLFGEEEVWRVEGHTKLAVEFLQTTTVFIVNGEVRQLGGPLALSADIRKRCIKRMRAWSLLVREVMHAEHPAFEVVSCFSCFDLDAYPVETKKKKNDITSYTLPNLYDEEFMRLAGAFGVDEKAVKREFFSIIPFAQQRKSRLKCSNLEAWRLAIRDTCRVRHPADSLLRVLTEYATISASDSIIERDFSRVKHWLGECKLTCPEITENDLVMVLLSHADLDEKMVEQAQDVYNEVYKAGRFTPRKGRADKGVCHRKRSRTFDESALPTETEWHKRRIICIQQNKNR